MNTLHVRSVPEELYEQIRRLALAQQRSLSAQVITLLERAVAEENRREQQADVLASIRRRRFTPTATTDSTALLREDRAR